MQRLCSPPAMLAHSRPLFQAARSSRAGCSGPSRRARLPVVAAVAAPPPAAPPAKKSERRLQQEQQAAKPAQPKAESQQLLPKAAVVLPVPAVEDISTGNGSSPRSKEAAAQPKQGKNAASADSVATAKAESEAPSSQLAVASADEKQERRRRRPNKGKRQRKAHGAALAAAAAGTAAAAVAANGAEPVGQAKKESGRRVVIPPKEEADPLSWYEAVVHSAEQATAPQRGRSGAAALPLAQALRRPVEGWLAERLEYIGFETRRFPTLAPLVNGNGAAPGRSSGDSGRGKKKGGAPAAASNACTTSAIAQWAQSEGDLPALASQWHTVPSDALELANAGILLHEAHAAHAWSGAAEEHARAMIELYEQFGREVAGLPVVAGRRSPRGVMSGAAATFTLEAVVGEGLSLQVAASHFLADNYTRALGVACRSGSDEDFFFSQMGSGLKVASLDAMIMAHGDDAGLRLPPELAPVQVTVVPMWYGSKATKAALAAEAERIAEVLAAAGVRAEVDGRRCGPGARLGGAARRGVPLVIEVGARDVAARTCNILRREELVPAGRVAGASSEPEPLVETVNNLLDDAQAEARWRGAAALESSIVDVSSYYELREVIEAGKWARGPFAGTLEDELAIQDETGATLRCYPLQQPTSLWGGFHTCLYSGYHASEVAIFARPL